MQRLFLAVTLPEEAREGVYRVQAGLREAMGETGIRWVAPPQFHYTLKFLGDVEESDITAIMEAAQKAARQMSPFRLAPAGVGVFPGQRSPQVLWIGARNGVPHLARLAEYLERELASAGFAPESKPYRPHLTLARMKTREGEESVAKTLLAMTEEERNPPELKAFDAAAFVLMRSELRPQGAVYTPQKTFAFGTQTE